MQMLCGPSGSKQMLLVINSEKIHMFSCIVKVYQIIWLILINNTCGTIVQGYTSHLFAKGPRLSGIFKHSLLLPSLLFISPKTAI